MARRKLQPWVYICDECKTREFSYQDAGKQIRLPFGWVQIIPRIIDKTKFIDYCDECRRKFKFEGGYTVDQRYVPN